MNISRPTTRREFAKALIRYRWDRDWLADAVTRIQGHPVVRKVLSLDHAWLFLHKRVLQDANFTDAMIRAAFYGKEDTCENENNWQLSGNPNRVNRYAEILCAQNETSYWGQYIQRQIIAHRTEEEQE